MPNNISLELLYYNSLSQVPTLVEGGQAEITRDSSGNYYIEVTTDFISYNSSPQGYPLLIRTTARYEDADLEPFVSYTKINILDYVLNYPYGEENLDIVDEMVNGVISVEIGNKQNLSINMFDFVEFDENNDDVLAKIRSFMNDLTEKGAWTVYTNLN